MNRKNMLVIGLDLYIIEQNGSVSNGLKQAGYSAAIHQGPGSTGKHIVVFDSADIKTVGVI